MIALQAGEIFDGRISLGEGVVILDGARIVGIAAEAPPGIPVDVWPEGTILAPGYIDAQVNGGGGLLLNDTPDLPTMAAIAAAHARTGTTTILSTLITDTPARRAAALSAAAEALRAGTPGIAGLHLEGPFLALPRRGAHPAAHVVAITAADIAALSAPFPGCLLVTLAPETVGPEAIATLATAGVIVFAGHTDTSYDQAMAALAAGAAGFTHLFNAMSQLTGREPGAIGAAFAHPSAAAGIIVDGIHVHPTNVALALRLMGPDRLFLVSDAMPTAASDVTSFTLGDRLVTLHNGRLTNADGTLAGAHLTMAEAVRNLVAGGAPWEDAVQMATATPATVLRLADRGRIEAGARADLVALDAELQVMAVWQGGARIQ
jgi:N-acetylglucosamine-6-phosphate deacetylase